MSLLHVCMSLVSCRGIRSLAVTLMLFGAVARGQQVDDNVVLSAEDAFGLTLGKERVGIYHPGDVRGFSPMAAGNGRLEGLYIDQRGFLSGRIIRASTVHVGIGAIGYPFPAPTGIVDYELRKPSGTNPAATIVASAGPFESRGLTVDGSLPLLDTRLQLPLGVGVWTNANNPGYTSRVTNFGAAPEWKPSDWLTFRAFWDRQEFSDVKVAPLYFSGGDFLPPRVDSSYHGQEWMQGESIMQNSGVMLSAQLRSNWLLEAGIFRSTFDIPTTYTDLYVNVQPDGMAQHLLVGGVNQEFASTSGEAHLIGRFSEGGRDHSIIILARGRSPSAWYGGYDVVDAGVASIHDKTQVPKPEFSFSDRTRDETRWWSGGVAYDGRWPGYGEVNLGVQRESYQKTVTPPGESSSRKSDSMWRGYGTITVPAGKRATFYTGYTQGLEDSGLAPDSAQNRGALLPATRTWQIDAGVRYLLTPEIKLIAGVFNVDKPYLSFDADNVYREIAKQRARGVEVSISGSATKRLSFLAGAVFGRVKVSGENLTDLDVGTAAFGQPDRKVWISVDYAVPMLPDLSLDLSAYHRGAVPASVDGAVQAPAQTLLSVGGRFKFTLYDTPAALRVQVANVTNSDMWGVYTQPGFSQQSPLSFAATLIVEL